MILLMFLINLTSLMSDVYVYQIHYLQYAAVVLDLEIRQEVWANSILLEKIVNSLSTKEFSSDLIYKLDQDCASFPLNSLEDFDELERKLEDPSAQEQLL